MRENDDEGGDGKTGRLGAGEAMTLRVASFHFTGGNSEDKFN